MILPRVSPPLSTWTAVVLMTISSAAGFVLFAYVTPWEKPMIPWGAVILGVLVFWFIRGLYRGQNWARLLLIVSFLGCLVAPEREFPHMPEGMAQNIHEFQLIAHFLSLILIFLPRSNAWFHQNRA